jgi:hypothetical protein
MDQNVREYERASKVPWARRWLNGSLKAWMKARRKVSPGTGGCCTGASTAMHVQSDGIVEATASSTRVAGYCYLRWCLPRLSAWQAAVYDTPRLDGATNNFWRFHHKMTEYTIYDLHPAGAYEATTRSVFPSPLAKTSSGTVETSSLLAEHRI